MTLSHLALRDFAERLLLAVDVPPDHAGLVAETLVAANLRGVDSHGVQMLRHYIAGIEVGDVDARTIGRVITESGACLLYDGCNGLGAVISRECSDHAVRMASQHGAAIVVARESNHFGTAAFWGQRIARAGHLALVFSNASPIVAPWQGKEPRLGTNPICAVTPLAGRWELDMATTTVAANKIFKAALNRQPTIPAGWAMDSEGAPTTDTEAAAKGLPTPLGGYKGSGLAMLVEMLCGVLSGGAMSTGISSPRWRGQPSRTSHCFIAIDVSRFMPIEQFEERVNELVAMIKSAAPAQGYDEVLVAGEPERRFEEERRRTGIPVEHGVWSALLEVADRLGVTPPAMQ